MRLQKMNKQYGSLIKKKAAKDLHILKLDKLSMITSNIIDLD